MGLEPAVGALDGVVDVLDHRAPDIPGRRMVRASA